MGLFDRFRQKKSPTGPEVTLSQVLSEYDLVGVNDYDGQPVVIVSERGGPNERIEQESGMTFAQPYLPRGQTSRGFPGSTTEIAPSMESAGFTEIGTSSPSPFTSAFRAEYNPLLQGQRGIKKCDEMRKGDGVIAGSLRTVKTPVLAARWFMQPDSQSTRDKNAANFVWDCLTKHMSISWSQVLVEALLMCDFGYYMFEIVWGTKVIDGQERVIFQKLAPRHPADVKQWVYDENGGPAGVWMFDPNPANDSYFIPIEKLLVFTLGREAGDICGVSILRPVFKHWYFKEQLYKIDAIQKERHGIGIPVIQLPPGFSREDRALADALGRNLRTNERAHVVLPPNWNLIFAKLEGQPVDALKSIAEHNNAIRENVLAGFQNPGNVTKDDDQIMFLKATRFIADVVCDTFNLYAIPKLMDMNFSRVGTPRLKARRIGEQADWRTLSFAVRNLIGAGALTADDELERVLREEMDLPEADPATARKVATPQAGPSANQSGKQDSANNVVGAPRQTPVAPTGTGSAGAGLDRSGGK